MYAMEIMTHLPHVGLGSSTNAGTVGAQYTGILFLLLAFQILGLSGLSGPLRVAEWLVPRNGLAAGAPRTACGLPNPALGRLLFPSRLEAVAVLLTSGSEQWGCCSGISGYQLPVFPGVAMFSQSAAGGKVVLDGELEFSNSSCSRGSVITITGLRDRDQDLDTESHVWGGNEGGVRKSPLLGIRDSGAQELMLMGLRRMLIKHETFISHKVNVSHVLILFLFWEQW